MVNKRQILKLWKSYKETQDNTVYLGQVKISREQNHESQLDFLQLKTAF